MTIGRRQCDINFLPLLFSYNMRGAPSLLLHPPRLPEHHLSGTPGAEMRAWYRPGIWGSDPTVPPRSHLDGEPSRLQGDALSAALPSSRDRSQLGPNGGGQRGGGDVLGHVPGTGVT